MSTVVLILDLVVLIFLIIFLLARWKTGNNEAPIGVVLYFFSIVPIAMVMMGVAFQLSKGLGIGQWWEILWTIVFMELAIAAPLLIWLSRKVSASDNRLKEAEQEVADAPGKLANAEQAMHDAEGELIRAQDAYASAYDAESQDPHNPQLNQAAEDALYDQGQAEANLRQAEANRASAEQNVPGSKERADVARRESGRWRIVRAIARIVAIIAALAVLLHGIDWGGVGALLVRNGDNGGEPNATSAASGFWGVWSCRDPKTETDDFGPCPENLEELRAHPEKALELLRKTSMENPIVGLSSVYLRDSLTGNRYLGSFYRSYQNDTDAINAALKHFTTGKNKRSSSEYEEVVKNSFDWLDSHDPKCEVLTSSELASREIVVSDQMYANAYPEWCDEDIGADGDIPAIVVQECGQGDDDDYYLVIDYWVKDLEMVEVYHINCLFQPCNTAKVMRVEVKPNPKSPASASKPAPDSKPTNPKPTEPKPTDPKPTEPKPTDPKPTEPDPTEPSYSPKDTSENIAGPNNGGAGDGTDTNNGNGATTSAADTEHGSTDMSDSNYEQTQDAAEAATGHAVTANGDGEDGTPVEISPVDDPTPVNTEGPYAGDEINDGGEWEFPP